MRERLALFLAVAVLAAALLAGAASVPLLDPDEARFARTSVEMLRAGDPVVPAFLGLPRLEKPPLLHWIQAALFRLLGPEELAARLPSILATLALAALSAWAAGRRYGASGSAWTIAVFAAFPLVVALGKVGTIDALLSLHVGAVLALELAGGGARRALLPAAVGAVLGLAFLAKGPVGVALPLLVLLAGRTVIGGEVVPGIRAWLAGAAAWCLVVLPWGLAFLWRVGLDTAAGSFRREVLERYFADDAPHGAPGWYYLGVVLVGFFPWGATLVLGIVRALGRRRDPAARTAACAAAGLVAGLAFLTIGRGKLPSYVLPLAPLAAVVIAWEIGQEIADPHGRRRGQILAATSIGVLAACLAIEAIGDVGFVFRRECAVGAAILGAGTAAAIAGIVRRRPRDVHVSVAVAALLFTAVSAAMAFPAIGSQRSAAALIRDVPVLGSGRPIATFEKQLPSLAFYLDSAPEWTGVAGVTERISRPDRVLLVVDQADLALLPPEARGSLRAVGASGRYRVFEPRPPGH